jgi:hypothetical protein
MARFYALFALALLAAGCAAPAADPYAIARAAADQMNQDQKSSGSLSGMVGSVAISSTGAEAYSITVGVTGVVYTGAALRMDVRATNVVMGGVESTDRERLHITLYCDATFVVVQTIGNDAWGGNDVNLETHNDAGACMNDANEAQLAASLGRINDQISGGLAKSLTTNLMSADSHEQRVVTEAHASGSQIIATYHVTGGDKARDETATIENGHIVYVQYTTVEGQTTTTATQSLSYTARSASPGLRGTSAV